MLANIPAIMPRYNIFLYNQRDRVRYPKTMDLPDIEAAKDAARRVAKVFMDVVPYWRDLSSGQQNRFVVEVVDEAGELVLTVPFKEAEEAGLAHPNQQALKRKKPHQDCSTDGARWCPGRNILSLMEPLDGSVRKRTEAVRSPP